MTRMSPSAGRRGQGALANDDAGGARGLRAAARRALAAALPGASAGSRGTPRAHAGSAPVDPIASQSNRPDPSHQTDPIVSAPEPLPHVTWPRESGAVLRCEDQPPPNPLRRTSLHRPNHCGGVGLRPDSLSHAVRLVGAGRKSRAGSRRRSRAAVQSTPAPGSCEIDGFPGFPGRGDPTQAGDVAGSLGLRNGKCRRASSAPWRTSRSSASGPVARDACISRHIACSSHPPSSSSCSFPRNPPGNGTLTPPMNRR